MKKFILFILFFATLFSGCQSLSDRLPLETKSKVEKEIAALNLQHAKDMEAQNIKIASIKDAIIAAQNGQMRGGANAFYAQDMLFGMIPSPVRSDLIWHNYTLEGWQALGHLTPDYETMAAINKRLKDELDETKTSLADLQKNHEKVMTDNQVLTERTNQQIAQLTQAQNEKEQLEKTYRENLDALGVKLKEANDKIFAIEKARADDSAAIQALKTKISIGCAVFALLCAAGAIYSPVGKGGLAALCAVVALAGAAIWVITAFEVTIAVLVCIAILIVWGLKIHHTSDKGVKAFANLLGEKPELVAAADEWTTKYVTSKDGTVTTVPDTAVQALVKSKLIANDKA